MAAAKHSTTTTKQQRDILADVTASIIAALEAGTTPWRRPWKDGKAPANGAGMPHNAVTGRAYSGVNFVILSMLGMAYQSQGWLTFKQAQELGGSVRKGEKGSHIVFWKRLARSEKDETGAEKQDNFMMMRSYVVFSVE